MTYSVADLVIPIPDAAPSPANDDSHRKKPPKPAEADFQSLVELIKATVKPESWDNSDTTVGDATIQPFDNNLSLVIAQNQKGHEQIRELLEQLRRQRGVKACVEMRPVNDAHKLCEILTIDPQKRDRASCHGH